MTGTLHLETPLPLKEGGRLEGLDLAYETFGTLNEDRSNAILVCHPLTMDAHVADGEGEKGSGWWSFLIGPGCPIDTRHNFILCSNVLGGCKGSTGPLTTNPATGEAYRTDFPEICIEDMVDAQKHLVDHFGITRLRAVVGGSLGGMQALEWSLRYPNMVGKCIAIATGPRLSSQGLAFDVVGRRCITSDPDWKRGHYPLDGQHTVMGLALARMIGHITYISKNIMDRKFGRTLQEGRSGEGFNTAFAVESFLQYNSEKFIKRFDPNSYLYLSKAMNTFDLSGEEDDLRERIQKSEAEFLLVSFSSDWLFPPQDTTTLATKLVQCSKRVTTANIETDLGHDAFLIDAEEVQPMKELVHHFLEGP